MRVLASVAAASLIALSLPLGSAVAAMPIPAGVAQTDQAAARIIKADWNNGYGPHWHEHWRHEWRGDYGPERHWHRHWEREMPPPGPYGYYIAPPPPPPAYGYVYGYPY